MASHQDKGPHIYTSDSRSSRLVPEGKRKSRRYSNAKHGKPKSGKHTGMGGK